MAIPLRRILKYAPAVVVGLLLVTWVVSAFRTLRLTVDFGESTYILYNHPGCCELFFGRYSEPIVSDIDLSHFPNEFRLDRLQECVLGHLGLDIRSDGFDILLPFSLLVTVFIPLAIGPFFSFRFRLGHYLAYTALVAVELAYYLQWQE